MVNYHGPKAIRGLVEALEIPIFNRVSQIRYRLKDVSGIQLDKQDVARLDQLQEISVTTRGNTRVNDADVKTVEDIIPACRTASVDKTENQINVRVTPGTALACCSR